MSDPTIPPELPAAAGWASQEPQSPGAAEHRADDTLRAPDCWCSTQSRPPGAAEAQSASGDRARDHGERFASFGALLSAFIASSWCWLPPLLIVGGISGAGMMTFLQDYRPIFMTVTFGLLGGAFYLSYRPRGTARGGPRSRIMAFNKVLLWGVTAIAVVLLFVPPAFFSPTPAEGEVTAEMQRTVMQVKGITWHTWIPKARKALESAPGVLAVEVDSESGQATIGTARGKTVATTEILAALRSAGFDGEIVERPPDP